MNIFEINSLFTYFWFIFQIYINIYLNKKSYYYGFKFSISSKVKLYNEVFCIIVKNQDTKNKVIYLKNLIIKYDDNDDYYINY